MVEQADRNQTIYLLWRDEHMTFAGIGRRFGLSRERIRQIVQKENTKLDFSKIEKLIADKEKSV